MSESPSTFAPEESRVTASGKVARCRHTYRFSFPRESGKTIAQYTYDFSAHPFKHLLRKFFFISSEEANAGTLNCKGRAVKILGEFMAESGEHDLSPEVFKRFIDWAIDAKGKGDKPRFSEISLVAYVNNVRLLYKSGIEQRHKSWDLRGLDLITELIVKKFRGRSLRSIHKSIATAMSLVCFQDLVKAVSIEFEECRRVLRERNAGHRESLYNLEFHNLRMIDPNPFVVFALLAGIRLGLRSSEFNAISSGDIVVDMETGHHELYVHAPDKADDYIPIDDIILESIRFCEEWGREARESATEEEQKQFENIFLVYRATNSGYRTSIFPMTTHRLNTTHLPYFYNKYFNYRFKNETGEERPLLHADRDTSRPLQISYRKIRNAFAIRFVEQVPNRSAAQRAMRHKSSRTTGEFYLHQTKLDHAKKVHAALKSEAQLLTLSLKNGLEVGISEETIRKAKDAGAITPQGICGRAMNGIGCERASDCLECPFLVVIASRRPRFVADRDEYLQKAEESALQGDHRIAENFLKRAALCEAQIIRIDDLLSEGEK